MSNGPLRIEKVTIRELPAYIRNFFAQDAHLQPTAPISIQRADAMSLNPHAEPEDIGLLVAYAGNRCVGYQGILPGRIVTENGTSRLYWCSGGFVLPEYRNRMVALRLLQTLITLGHDIALTAYSPTVDAYFRASGFERFGPLRYLVGFVERLDVIGAIERRTRARSARLSKVVGILRPIQRRVYPAIRQSLYRLWVASSRRKVILDRISIQEVSEIRPVALIPPKLPRFDRSVAVLNWMLSSPWIVSGGNSSTPEYYFGDIREFFRYAAYEVLGPGDRYLGFAIFSIQTSGGRTTLKLTDSELSEEYASVLVYLVSQLALKFRADRLELPLCLARHLYALPGGRLVLEEQTREYLGYGRGAGLLKIVMNDLVLSYADSDAALS